MKKLYYQVVREPDKYGIKYTIYEARKDKLGLIELADSPFVLVGNHPDEILDSLKKIEKDMKNNAPIDKSDCDDWEDDFTEDEDEDTYEEDLSPAELRDIADGYVRDDD